MSFYDFYSKRKVSRLGLWLNNYLTNKISRYIEQFVKHNSSIVEIGTGDGRIARNLYKHYNYTGYEPNPRLAGLLQSEGISIRTKFVPPLMENDTSINAAVALHVLEHMDGTEKAMEFLSEINRILVPGGYLFLLFPDYIDMKFLFYDVDHTHGYVTTPNRVWQLLTDKGFQVVKAQFFYGALPFFPGYFCNLVTKIFFLFWWNLHSNFFFRLTGFSKLSYMFSRSMLFICTKNANPM